MKIAVGTDQGVMVLEATQSKDRPWALMTQGLVTRRIQALAASPDRRLYAACNHGLVSCTQDGENWRTFAEGLNSANIRALSLHPSEPDTLYAGVQPAGIYRSQDAGMHWERLPGFNAVPGAPSWSFPLPPYQARVSSLRQHPQHPRALVAGVALGGLVASLDGGLTWAERHTGLSREVQALAMHPARPARIYAATGGGVFRSEDLAATWQPLPLGLPYSFTQALAVDPEDPECLMVAVTQKRDGGAAMLARSSNGGQSWLVTARGLPLLHGHCVTCMASIPGSFVFGTDQGGLFVTTDFGENWRVMWPGCPPIRSLLGLD